MFKKESRLSRRIHRIAEALIPLLVTADVPLLLRNWSSVKPAAHLDAILQKKLATMETLGEIPTHPLRREQLRVQ
jgi:hypothetical protein